MFLLLQLYKLLMSTIIQHSVILQNLEEQYALCMKDLLGTAIVQATH